MIKNDNLFFGEDGRKRLMQGIKKVSEAVGCTMGSSGKNSLIECIESPSHLVTNDGYSIANAIKLADPLEDMGKNILLESINKANKISGDGSSATCVLTAGILHYGQEYLKEYSPMEIKRSLEKHIPVIEESILSQSVQVTTDELKNVATTSSEDESIGEMIEDIYKNIGKEGIIHWEKSITPKDHYSLGAGIKIEGAGWATRYLCDIDERTGTYTKTIHATECPVLITKQKISRASQLDAITNSLHEKGIGKIAIFCDDIDSGPLSSLIKARQVNFRAIVVKMPVLFKDEWYEDLAAATGAKVLDASGSYSLQNYGEKQLGSLGKIIVNEDDVFIEGVRNLAIHISQLQSEGSDASLLRASRLNLKTATYFVGGESESAIAYRRLKVEDAINAASCALHKGIVVGGGVALANAIRILPENEVGAKILKKALLAPVQWIVANAGVKEIHIDSLEGHNGFNSKTGKIEDLFKNGIVDPAEVVINSMKNAIGVAATILTAGTVITLPREEQNPQLIPGIVR